MSELTETASHEELVNFIESEINRLKPPEEDLAKKAREAVQKLLKPFANSLLPGKNAKIPALYWGLVREVWKLDLVYGAVGNYADCVEYTVFLLTNCSDGELHSSNLMFVTYDEPEPPFVMRAPNFKRF